MSSLEKTKKTAASYTPVQIIGLLILLLCAANYILLGQTTHGIVEYSALLFMLFLGILMINDFNIIHADTLFVAFFVYSVGLGPIALSFKGTGYSFDYFHILLLPLLCFALGNVWGNLFQRRNRSNQIRVNERKIPITINMNRHTLLNILYVISIILSLIYLYQNRILFAEDFSSGRVTAAAGRGIMTYLMGLPTVVMPMMLDLYLRPTDENVHAPSRLSLTLMTLVAAGTLFIGGFRANVVTMFICMLVLYCGRRGLGAGRIFLYGAGLVILVALLGMFRDANGLSITETIITGSYVNGLNLQYVLSSFPDRIPFQGGYTYLINLLMLLPGPDLDFTLWLKEQLGLSFSGGGVTPTIIGEFYINFGELGIGIGMAALGFVGTRINQYFISSGQCFFSVYLVWQFAHCVSGGVANVMVPIIVYGIVYLFVCITPVSKTRERELMPVGAAYE